MRELGQWIITGNLSNISKKLPTLIRMDHDTSADSLHLNAIYDWSKATKTKLVVPIIH